MRVGRRGEQAFRKHARSRHHHDYAGDVVRRYEGNFDLHGDGDQAHFGETAGCIGQNKVGDRIGRQVWFLGV